MQSRLFERKGERKQICLVVRQTNKLQADGQAAWREARGYTHRGHAGLRGKERISGKIERGPFFGIELRS